MTSEHHPHSRTELICLGTTIPPAPLSPATGTVTILNVIPCVPFPDRPSTDRKLRLITREEVKGAVTALSSIGSQGFLVVGQGQKILVRGLKEDGRLMPVAFMDVGCHVTSLRNLPGTGLTLMGDAVRGVGVVGYMEEPYKLVLFGKSASKVEATAVEFLPDGSSLFIIVADAEGNLHTLQFDPERKLLRPLTKQYPPIQTALNIAQTQRACSAHAYYTTHRSVPARRPRLSPDCHPRSLRPPTKYCTPLPLAPSASSPHFPSQHTDVSQRYPTPSPAPSNDRWD